MRKRKEGEWIEETTMLLVPNKKCLFSLFLLRRRLQKIECWFSHQSSSFSLISYFSVFFVLLLVHRFMASSAVAVRTNITTDQSALLALKGHITDDPYKILASNWSTSTSVCNWVGIKCGAKHLRVTSLNLSHMGFSGTIAPQLGNLTFLFNLSFRNNNFHGSLPNELASLRRLEVVYSYQKTLTNKPQNRGRKQID